MDNRIKSSLGGRSLRINWKSQAGLQRASELAQEFGDEVFKLKDDKAISKRTAQYYKDACELMFEFDNGAPEDEFFKSDDFPTGEFEVLQARFFNPTRVI